MKIKTYEPSNGNLVVRDDQQNANLVATSSAAGDTSIVLTTESVGAIIRQHNELDAQVREQLIKRRSLLSLLRPSELDRVIAAGKLQSFKQAINQSLCINELLYQNRMRQLQAITNASTKAVETTMSASLTVAQAQTYKEVERAMNETKQQTALNIMQECKFVDRITNKELKEMYMRSIDETIRRAFDTYSKLINKFVATLNSSDISIPNNMLEQQ